MEIGKIPARMLGPSVSLSHPVPTLPEKGAIMPRVVTEAEMAHIGTKPARYKPHLAAVLDQIGSGNEIDYQPLIDFMGSDLVGVGNEADDYTVESVRAQKDRLAAKIKFQCFCRDVLPGLVASGKCAASIINETDPLK